MKVALASDLHLEFGDLTLKNTENADVLLLAGDVCIATDLLPVEEEGYVAFRSERFHDFFQRCSAEFPHVIYISGNHEHYHGDYAFTLSLLKDRLSYLKNLTILDNETITIGDTVFFGGTLWTDMNQEDPVTLSEMKRAMNDFIQVKNSNVPVSPYGKTSRFLPEDAVADHKIFLSKLDTVLKDDTIEQVVVVGHHAPSKLSTKPRYQNDTIMNGGYSSDLSEIMLQNPKIKLWCHGHTHDDFDYLINTTRVVCNPRGYIGYEQRADSFDLKYIEV